MLEQDFLQQIKKPDRFRNAFNYTICISLLFASLYFYYRFFQSLRPNSETPNSVFLTLIFPSLAIYGLWRISKDFKVIKVASNQSLAQKRKVIDEYLKTINVIDLTKVEDMYKVQYRNRYSNSVDINIAFDDEFYYLNAKANGLGMIDFGFTKRVQKKMARFFISKASM